MRSGRWLVLLSLAAAGALRADFDDARALYEAGEVAAAVEEFERLAAQDDVRAQYALGVLNLEGIGRAADALRAMEWFCLVAHHPVAGEPVYNAVWHLGYYYNTGGGTPGGQHRGRLDREDPIRAYFWFTIQADQQRIFDGGDEHNAKLGSVGRLSAARNLYPEEMTAIEHAVQRWDPGRPVESPSQCLRLPDGLGVKIEGLR